MFTKCYFLVECLQDQVVLFWSNGHIYITSIYILAPRWTCIVTFYHNMFAGTSPWHLFTPTSPWLLVGRWPQKLFPLDPFVEFVAGVIVNSKVSLGELSLTGEEEFLEIDTDLLCQFISSEYLRLDGEFYFDDYDKTKELFQGWFRVSGLLRHNELGQPWHFKQKEVGDI